MFSFVSILKTTNILFFFYCLLGYIISERYGILLFTSITWATMRKELFILSSLTKLFGISYVNMWNAKGPPTNFAIIFDINIYISMFCLIIPCKSCEVPLTIYTQAFVCTRITAMSYGLAITSYDDSRYIPIYGMYGIAGRLLLLTGSSSGHRECGSQKWFNNLQRCYVGLV